MEPEPEPIDLSALDPSRDRARWESAIAHVADRAVLLARLRKRVTRRGAIAVAVSAAAVIALWLTTTTTDRGYGQRRDLLDWATRDVGAADVLTLGGNDAR